MAGGATPSSIGARAEAAVASALVRAGRSVFVPVFTVHDRIDLIYVGDRGPVRVQCKSARRMRNVLFFRTCSNTANAPRIYAGEIDEFGVYSPETELVYLVPAGSVPSRGCSNRLSATHNRQRSGVRWARDYQLGPP